MGGQVGGLGFVVLWSLHHESTVTVLIFLERCKNCVRLLVFSALYSCHLRSFQGKVISILTLILLADHLGYCCHTYCLLILHPSFFGGDVGLLHIRNSSGQFLRSLHSPSSIIKSKIKYQEYSWVPLSQNSVTYWYV